MATNFAKLIGIGALVVAHWATSVDLVHAEQQGPSQRPPPTAAAPSAQAAVVMPDAEKIVLLIRTALLTLNDAVQTGNFTVLRDRAAPSFRAANTAARLAIIFQDLSRRSIDLTTVAIHAPQLTATQAIDANQRLSLTGYFPGDSMRVEFDLLFETVEGRWRLFGMSVNPVQATADSAKRVRLQPPSKAGAIVQQPKKGGPPPNDRN